MRSRDHLSYGITQCTITLLPAPDRGDYHAFTPSVLPVLIYRPRKDERLSWPRWLVISRWFTANRWSPTQVLTGPDVDRDQRAKPGRHHNCQWPTD